MATLTSNQIIYNLNKSALIKWIKKNIYSMNDDLATYLLEKKLVTPDTINNYNEYDEGDREYVPQEVFNWYVVSKTAYKKLTELGDVTFEWKGVLMWGRSCCGQDLEMDYYYQQEKLLKLLDKRSISN